MRLWIVGYVPQTENWPPPWEFTGVFDDEAKADQACTTTDHFVGPATLNVRIADGLVEWPGIYYPRRDS